MAYGDAPFDKDLKENWAKFCDRLKEAGDRVFKDLNPPTAVHRIDGFRYLVQNLGQAFDLALETRDTKYPMIHTFSTPTRKLGSDNADCIYMQAWIDGESVYKISGTKGTARFWNIAVQGPKSDAAYGSKTTRPLHDPFGDTPEANIFGHELKTNWDGSFELFIGGEKRGPNWLPTTKDTRKLFFRQYFDSFDEEAAQYRIERVDMAEPRPIPTPDQMIEAMHWAGEFCYNVVDFWPEWVWDSGDQIDPEALNEFRGANLAKDKPWTPESETIDTRRGRLITMMRWQLEDDEAVIVEFDSFDGFWMITSEGLFGNSMDFLYRNVSYSPSRTKVDPDGKIRLVLTKNDPGYTNWIDNQGYNSGVLTYRNILTRHVPDLRTKVTKLEDLALHMPEGSPKSTPEERNAELHARFDTMRRRYRL